MAPKDIVTDRLNKKLAAFRKNVVASAVPVDGGHCFAYLDKTSPQWARGAVLYIGDNGKPRSWTVNLPGSSGHAARDPWDIARMVVEEALPDGAVAPLPASDAVDLFGLRDGNARLAGMIVDGFMRGLSADEQASVDREAFVDMEAARLNKRGLEIVRQMVNADALAALKGSSKFGWLDYTFFAASGDRGIRRRQAAEAYPMMATIFSDSRRISLKMAIDTQKSLNGAIMTMFGGSPDDGVDDSPFGARRPRRHSAFSRAAASKAQASEEAADGKLTKGLLKRLQGLEWPTHGVEPEKLIKALSEVPPDWFPKTADDWEAFCDLTATIGTSLKDSTRVKADVLYGGCKGQWRDFAKRCAKAYTDRRPPEGTTEEAAEYFQKGIDWKALDKAPEDDIPAMAQAAAEGLDVPEGVRREDVVDWIKRLYTPDHSRTALRNACLDVEDVIEKFADQIILPTAARETGLKEIFVSEPQIQHALASAADVLFAAKAAPNIFEISNHFHNNYMTLLTQILEGTGQDASAAQQVEVVVEGEWAPLIQSEVVAPNGVHLKPLITAAELEQEGRRGINGDGSEGLHHCVGTFGYADKCKSRGHHIIGVRRYDEDGVPQRLSTVELGPVANGSTDLDVRQHRAKHNGTPDPAAAEAFEWLQASVRSGAIKINYDGIKQFMAREDRKLDDIERRCGYDWKRAKHIPAAMRPWGHYVGKKYRKMKFDDFAKQPELVSVTQSIRPGYKPKP